MKKILSLFGGLLLTASVANAQGLNPVFWQMCGGGSVASEATCTDDAIHDRTTIETSSGYTMGGHYRDDTGSLITGTPSTCTAYEYDWCLFREGDEVNPDFSIQTQNSCTAYHLKSGEASLDYYGAARDSGSLYGSGNILTFYIKFYAVSLNSNLSAGLTGLRFSFDSGYSTFYASFGADGIYQLYNVSTWQEVGTDLNLACSGSSATGCWQEWQWVCTDWDADKYQYCDIWRYVSDTDSDWTKVATNYLMWVNTEALPNGVQIMRGTNHSTGAETEVYIDRYQIGSGTSYLIDEPFNTLDDWTDTSVSSGVATISTQDGESTLDLSVDGSNYASVNTSAGTLPSTYNIKYKVWHDSLGNSSDQYYQILMQESGSRLFVIGHFNGGVGLYRSPTGIVEVGTDENEVCSGPSYAGCWQEWHLIVNSTAQTVTGYVNDSLAFEDEAYDYNLAPFSEGYFRVTQYALSGGTHQSWMDYVQVW